MPKGNFNPKVSIVIPVYNGSNYLKEAIDSALAQTYKNTEVIVVNDGSTDNGATDKIAKSYGDKIKYYSKENGGVATALNYGVKKMTGEYFSWLSHDDIYKPYKVERQIDYLSKLKNKNVVLYSDYELMNERGKLVEKRIQDHEMLERAPVYSLLRGILNGITILVPKAAFEKYGNFDTSLWCTQDYDMWLRVFNDYQFVHQPEVLSRTRVHDKQDTRANPKVVTEGNVLWKRMIRSVPDAEKVKAEGSLFMFYLEMIKFLKHTPYKEVIDFCGGLLEEAAQTQETGIEGSQNIDQALIRYDELLGENQKRAAAYYLINVIKQLKRNNKTNTAVKLISNKLVGKVTGLEEKSIENNYISKISNKSVKPRLMFCIGHWLTGGMERVLSNLFKQLSDEYDLFLISASDEREGKIKLPDYVTHIKISNELLYNSYPETALSYALLFDVDIIIGFMNLFNGQLEFYELCSGTGIKTVASNHEVYFYPYHHPDYYGLIQKRVNIFKNIDASLWLTNFSAAAYGLAANNSYLIPNPNTYKIQEESMNHKDKIILCVARFNDHVKRVDRMLRCFSIVSKTHPDAKLMLVGKYDKSAPIRPGDKTTLSELIEELKINEKRVEFAGEVANVDKYYSEARVLLLTSMSEGFGMVINEAASFGVPSVCNKIPGLEDLVTNGENGYLIEQDDIESMATAVNQLLSDDRLYKQMSNKAKEMVARFDEVKIGSKWKYLFKTLLKDVPATSKKLREELAYTITDHAVFERELFREISKMVSINLDERNELMKPRYGSTADFVAVKFKHNYGRLRKSIAKRGALDTGKLVMKKTFLTTRRVYKKV